MGKGESAMVNNEKVKLLGFEKAVFSKDQLHFVAWRAQLLQSCVERYKISPDSVEIDEAQEHEEANPGTVFTLAPAFGNLEDCQIRYALIPELWDGEDEYYISEIKIDDSAADADWAYTIIDLYCTVCKGPGYENKDCLNCVDGELSVDLTWDENWNVTAEYSDPRS
jgi:hypothetical protein